MNITDVADRFLGQYRQGANNNITARCPIHRKADGSMEKTPSFTLSLSTGLWHCFSCKEGGGLRSLLVALGVSQHTLSTTYAALIQEANGNISEYKGNRSKTYILRPTVVDSTIDERILGHFDKCPVKLVEEGFEEETLRRFEVGFDEIHFRITFPIRDEHGTLFGISGRTVINEFPRYKVYDKEYVVYGYPHQQHVKKGNLLWNLHNVYMNLYSSRKPQDLYLVEGFKACMWLWQSGIKNVVALLGSSLTEYQEELLVRTGSDIILMLDNDDAGKRGTSIVGEKLSKKTKVKVVSYQKAQPDGCSREELQEVVKSNENYFEWKIGKHNGIIREKTS